MSFQAAFYVFVDKDTNLNSSQKGNGNDELITPREAQQRWEAAKRADALSECLDFFGRKVHPGELTPSTAPPSPTRSHFSFNDDHNQAKHASRSRSDSVQLATENSRRVQKKSSGFGKLMKLMRNATEERDAFAGRPQKNATRSLPPKLAQGKWLKERQNQLPDLC
mmetsp:Transcript_17256/g.36191  ORF Transcript_17256/g.36191 Transcript_17256/m.36191 type:complete len:166 (-) Transcript_17256:199-696(-)